MGILLADGFDDWTASAGGIGGGEYETIYAASNAITAAAGRRSTAALYYNGSSQDYLQKTLPTNPSELFACFAIRPFNVTAGYSLGLCSYWNGSTCVAAVRINPDGSISVLRGTQQSGTVLGTTAAGVVPFNNTWTHLQIRIVFSTTVGVVQVRVNGVTTPVLNLSAQNTGAASITAFRLASEYFGVYMYLDDFVLSDTTGSVCNSWPGDVRVDTYLPNANGDLSQMTGSDSDSTNNYALVNAAAPGGSTYVQGQSVGNEDLYGFADMSHTPAAILGVVATAAALKDDAGTRSVRLHCKSGTTDVRSAADMALSTSRQRLATVFETDPNTSAAWTKTAFNAAQFGFEVTV